MAPSRRLARAMRVRNTSTAMQAAEAGTVLAAASTRALRQSLGLD